MIRLKFTVDERGHRRFRVGDRRYRAFWSTGYRRWTAMPLDPTTGDADRDAVRHFPNWGLLEARMAVGLEPPAPAPVTVQGYADAERALGVE